MAAYNNAIRIYINLNRLDDALALSKDVINKYPTSDVAWCNLGVVVLALQNTSFAQQCFEVAASLSNYSNSVALNNLGHLYESMGASDKAEECYRQALSIDNTDENSAYSLGLLLVGKGDIQGASNCFQRCITLNPSNAQASFQHSMLLASGNATQSFRLNDSYIKQLFDYYAAAGYDQHLVDTLRYRGPDVLWNVFSQLMPKEFIPADGRVLRVLDLGCGTGLMGAKFRECFFRYFPTDAKETPLLWLEGCDISDAMVKVASFRSIECGGKAVRVYDRVQEGDCAEVLRASAEEQAPWDLVLAADVMGYIGDMKPLLGAVKRRLSEKGLFLFTVEELLSESSGNKDVEYVLRNGARFVHSKEYIFNCASLLGFKVLFCEEAVIREEELRPVQGLVLALALSQDSR